MNKFMRAAIKEGQTGIRNGEGGPFGSVIVKNGEIVGRGHNQVIKQNDPTSHGEIEAIRNACRNLNTFDLRDCELYTTAAPCPMCRGAIQWSNIRKVYYGCTVTDTATIGFRDKDFYEQSEEISEEVDREACLELFNEYRAIKDKRMY